MPLFILGSLVMNSVHLYAETVGDVSSKEGHLVSGLTSGTLSVPKLFSDCPNSLKVDMPL